MIQNILGSIHTKFGKYLVSTILGIGLASIFRKSCQNKECLVFNAPHHQDITDNIYRHNNKCYRFDSSSISCNTKKKTSTICVIFLINLNLSILKMSLGTTSISELPVSNSSGPPANIQLQARETNEVVANASQDLSKQREIDDAKLLQQKQAPPNPQDFMKQVESDVQASKGQLQLPQRDIPRENSHITQDNHVKPNYIPEGPDDYIKKYQTNEVVQEVNKKKEEKLKNIDFLYEELQTPIIITLLYFLFQLPVVKKTLIKNIPKLFKNDGKFKYTRLFI